MRNQGENLALDVGLLLGPDGLEVMVSGEQHDEAITLNGVRLHKAETRRDEGGRLFTVYVSDPSQFRDRTL